jgi:AhpD family alkylhydroperoxidase
MPRLPLVPVDSLDPVVARVFEYFTRQQREPIALYRKLAHAPWLLDAYSGLARALRHQASTPRALRELAILRVAQLSGSDYELVHHREMASAAGVPAAKVEQLAQWSTSGLYDERERAALRCAEEVTALALSDEAFAELERLFEPDEIVELVVLCAFYGAVARMIQGLGVELEHGS